MSVELAIELITLLVAAVGPFAAYYFARRLFVSGNRHSWINALRDDLADLISKADSLALSAKQTNELVERLQSLRFRIRLRLVAGKPMHDRLIRAIENYLGAPASDQEERDHRRQELVDASEALIDHVWKNVERGK